MYTIHYTTSRGAHMMKPCKDEAALVSETKRLFSRRQEAFARDASNTIVAEVWRATGFRRDYNPGVWRWAVFI